jgi:pilus assembly protein Flp/PilA
MAVAFVEPVTRRCAAFGSSTPVSGRHAAHGIAEKAAMQLREGLMDRLVGFVKSLARNEEGQDLLEYALLVALIALVAVAAVTAAGLEVQDIFTAIANKLAATT